MAILLDDAASQCLLYPGPQLKSLPFTMACWFLSDSITLTQTLMCLGHIDAVDSCWSLNAAGATGGDPIQALSRAAGASVAAATTTGYSANTWTHAAGVFGSTTSRIAYVDGGDSGSNATSSNPAAATEFDIGTQSRNGGRSQFLSGKIGEAVVYDCVLSPLEIQLLANGVRPEDVRPGNLIYLLSFRDSNRGVYLNDTGRYGITMTVGNGVNFASDFPPRMIELKSKKRKQFPGATAAAATAFPWHYYQQMMAG